MTRSREEFTVRVLRNGSGAPAGVGFVVDETHIVTCAHVVNTALGRNKLEQDPPDPGARIQVALPMLNGDDDAPALSCMVQKWVPPPTRGVSGGDVAGLAVDGDELPELARAAWLADYREFPDAEAKVFGYPGDPPRTENGGWATVRVRGRVGRGMIQLDVASESAFLVQPGYSGSPVVVTDTDGHDLVVGMLSAADANGAKDALAIPVTALPLAWPEVAARLPIRKSLYLGEDTEFAYAEQARQIAPPRLLDRDEELADVASFCAGGQAYEWWRGPPWSGKSALAAWFALHPPAGMHVVSFFVDGNLAGHADSDAFTEALIGQLASLAGEPGPRTTAREVRRQYLLEAAAARLRDRGHELVLLVDGLDEDQGGRPASGRPSIASQLPRRPPDGVRVLVTSREHPGIPSDVPGDHPLRQCPQRMLRPSPHAHHVEIEATDEFLQRLHGDPGDREVIALITAAGGGLNAAELAELTGRPRWEIAGHMDSAFGRSFRSFHVLAAGSHGSRVGSVFSFAHETLRVTAEQVLGADLGPYRERLHQWAGSYQMDGWPDTTPAYLLQRYGRMLAAINNLDSLAALACDSARHDQMLRRTGSDTPALTEMTTAQQLLLASDTPCLTALAGIAAEWDRIGARNFAIPAVLPAVWAVAGETGHALDLARSLPHITWQVRALAEVAIALSTTDPGRAARIVEEAESAARAVAEDQEWVLCCVAEVQTAAGLWEQAERTARAVSSDTDQARLLADLARTLARDNPQRAAQLAEETVRAASRISAGESQAAVLEKAAQALAVAGFPERAERTAQAVSFTIPAWGALVVARIAASLAVAAPRQAARLARITEREADAVTDSWHARDLASIAGALAGVAPNRAARLAEKAEQCAEGITGHFNDSWEIARFAEALAQAAPGRAARLAEKAERAAGELSDSYQHAQAMAAVAEAWCAIRLWDKAERAARAIISPADRSSTLARVCTALADAGADERAENLAHAVPDPQDRASALTHIARAVAASDPKRAARVAAEAERTARTFVSGAERIRLLAALTEGLTAAGLWDRAERTARANPSPGEQIKLLAQLTQALTAAGLWDRAERTSHGISDPVQRMWLLAGLAEAMAVSDPARAGRLAAQALPAARDLPDPASRAKALARVAQAVAATDTDQARLLAAEAQHSLPAVTVPWERVPALAGLAEALARTDPDRAARLLDEALRMAPWVMERRAVIVARTALARTLAAVGAWDGAEYCAGSISSGGRDHALKALAAAMAEAGLGERAEQAGRAIATPEDRARALASVAAALAGTDPGRAALLATEVEQAARDITSGQALVRVLVSLAEALIAMKASPAASGDKALDARLRRVLGRALATRTWWIEALPLVGREEPTAVIALQDRLLPVAVADKNADGTD